MKSKLNHRQLKGGAEASPSGDNQATPSPPAGNKPPGNNKAPPAGNNKATAPGGNQATAPGGNQAAPPGGNKPAGENTAALSNNNKSKNNKNIGNKAKEVVDATASKIKNTLGSAKNSIKDYTNVGKLSNKVAQVGNINKYLIILFAGIALVGFMYLLRYIVIKYYNSLDNSPYLVSGTKSGKNTVVIYQDPDSINYIPINRSENEDGMEFTYSFWILIMDISYRPGQWKHVFHKGGSTSYPNRAPGVWLHPTKNSIRVYMNTFNDPLEYVDVDNIPVKKWVCVQLVLQNINSHRDEPNDFIDKDRNHVLDIYVNGNVKKSKILDSIPKQNNGNLWVNLFGGFDGYLSKLRYYNKALKYEEIQDIVNQGPSTIITSDTGEMPPYLDNSWWKN